MKIERYVNGIVQDKIPDQVIHNHRVESILAYAGAREEDRDRQDIRKEKMSAEKQYDRNAVS